MNALPPLEPKASTKPASPAPTVDMPRPLPFLLNMLLASALGFYLGGWQGALAGAGALLLVLGGFFLAPQIAWARRGVERAGHAAWLLLRPLVGLALLPLVMLAALIVGLFLMLGERVGHLVRRPMPTGQISPVKLLREGRALLAGLLAPMNLPMTAVNALLLVVLGCVAIGIQVAFYAALAAVPVMIVTLVMVAIESSREPDDGPASG